MITNVVISAAPIADFDLTEPIHRSLQRKRLLPGMHLADTGFVDAELMLAAQHQWGVPEDLICQGDYVGDGKTDVCVWRPSADPAQNFFYIRRSSDGALQSQEWGQNGDFPVSNWNVH